MPKNPRLSGGVCLIAGTVLTYLCIWTPYQDAVNHADHLSLSLKGVIMAVFALLYGPAMLILPMPVSSSMAAPARSPLHTLVAIVILGLSVGFYFWFKGVLSGMGYNFDGM